MPETDSVVSTPVAQLHIVAMPLLSQFVADKDGV